MKVLITWPSGLKTVEETEATSLDAYAMERWGRDAASELAEYGVTLEPAPAAEEPTASAPADTPPADSQPATASPTETTDGTQTESQTITSSDVGDLNQLLNT